MSPEKRRAPKEEKQSIGNGTAENPFTYSPYVPNPTKNGVIDEGINIAAEKIMTERVHFKFESGDFSIGLSIFYSDKLIFEPNLETNNSSKENARWAGIACSVATIKGVELAIKNMRQTLRRS